MQQGRRGEAVGACGMGEEQLENPAGEDPGGEHGGAGQDGVSADDGRRAGEKQLFADEHPDERGDEGEDDEEISRKRRTARRAAGVARGVMAAEDDERGSGGGGEERGPAKGLKPLAGKEDGGDAEQHGHGADHERGVADGGEIEPLELDEELDGHAEEGGDEQETGFLAVEADAMSDGDGKHGERGEEEAVENHPGDGHLVERDASEVKAGAPEAGGEGACAIAEKGDAAA